MSTTITARRQCLRIAALDAATWVEQNASETFNDLVRETDGNGPTDEEYAAALRRFDGGFGGLSEAPSTSAGVPERWASVYDSEIERQYRRLLRRRIAEVEATSAA